MGSYRYGIAPITFIFVKVVKINYYYSGTFRKTGNTPTKSAASLSVIPAKAGIQWDFKPHRHPGFPFSRE
ncbi:MAG: hypothetical protein QME83_13150 [Thermodesulfobacteriota bacterium]|nr:hypothetical protein [Thermodesulfobacteriota bacterium]